MRHGHGTTSDKPKAKVRRSQQGARDMAKEEKDRERAIGGGQPNELGVVQGQNGEQSGPGNPGTADHRGKVRH